MITQSSTPTYFRYFNGNIDQVEVSTTPRSADWIKTEYNNQNSPSTFETLATVSPNTVSNTWDYNNRLTQTVVGPTTVNYTYDPYGQRLSYANGTTTTYYPSKFYNTDGTTPQKHIFALGMEIGEVNATGSSAVVRYTSTDALTGSNIITNSSDTIDETLDYYPYGGIRIDSGSYSDQRKFIGQEYDSDTGLDYLNARYYNSGIGQFISEDPTFLAVGGAMYQQYLINPQSQNSYSYANDNPITRSDPTGLYSWNQFAYDAAYTYNPLNALFGNNADQISNAISTGNWSEGAKAGAAIVGKTGAVIGGALAVGVGAGIAVETGIASTLVSGPGAIRGGINAGLNVTSQIIDDKISGNHTSLGDYAKIAGISYAGGALAGEGVKANVLIAGGTNVASQVSTGNHTVDPVKVGGSMLGAGFSSWAGSYLSKTSNLGLYSAQQYGLGRIGWTVETPIGVINSGIKKK